ncbi:cysteine synthase A [Aerococcaceae bacterium DSM 111176]|nr:cysteine synthase A [Aerococcaceae bacterium DSM 111176]
MLFNNILDSVGNTPLVKINHLDEDSADVYVKIEKNNPSGSVKDRPVKYILQDLLDRGVIKQGDTVIEPTSGNTGVGLAMAGAALGLKIVIVMPDSMSLERRQLIQAYGAELVLTPVSEGAMAGAKAKAEELAEERDGVILGQFANTANIKSHEETTAREILEDLGTVDAFIAGIGTSGTIVGVGNVFKENNPDTLIVGLEPEDSPLFSKGEAAGHKLQGLGTNFVPELFTDENIDRYVGVSNEDAFDGMRELASTQGILAGISSGANYVGAKRLAKELGAGKTVVTVLPDSGERYLSMGIFSSDQ